jgi:cell division control protein 6
MSSDIMIRPIISNHEYLNESHVPPYVIGRDKEIVQIKQCITPVARRLKPIHIWICGPSGSGKTAVTRHTLKLAEKEYGIRHIYINCWENTTLHSIMEKIVSELKILGAEKISTVFKLERFTKFIEGKPFILVLDEIDQIMPKDRNLILYNLCDFSRMGLICISVEQKCLYSLDERVRSRLNPRIIEFKTYPHETLKQILHQRAESSFAMNTWETPLIEKICSMANGNARFGLSILRNAAIVAENDKSPVIKHSHFEKGWADTNEQKLAALLDNLTTHHQLLYSIIKGRGNIMSGDLWNEYLSTCKSRKMNPMASRTFSLYIKQLLRKNLIRWERACTRGNVRIFKVAGNSRAQQNNINLSGDNLGNA